MAGQGKIRKFEQAIAALLSEKTVDLAAAKAGVTGRTLITWMKRADFQQQYRQARQAILERCTTRLMRLTDKAVDTLERNLDCDKAQTQTRTAVAVLDQIHRGLEVLDLAAEIKVLKQDLQGVRDVLSELASASAEDQGRTGIDDDWPPASDPQLNGVAATSAGASAGEADHGSP
jgi:hypothetical protein